MADENSNTLYMYTYKLVVSGFFYFSKLLSLELFLLTFQEFFSEEEIQEGKEDDASDAKRYDLSNLVSPVSALSVIVNKRNHS